MKEPNALNSVAEFHRTFQHPVLREPVVPSDERCNLRLALLKEELAELEEAVNSKDIKGVADALCDLQYVLSGAVLEFGLGDRFKELFDEVQRSNMSKACRTRKEAEETLEHYQRVHNTECYYREIGGKYLVYRATDNKTVKSINYSPADLDKVLKGENVDAVVYFG